MAEEFATVGLQQPPASPEHEREPGQDVKAQAQEVKAQAQAAWSEARESVRAAVTEKQQAAASGVHDFADALRNTARDLDHRQQTTTARLAAQAADSLDRLSTTLRSKDAATMLDDVQAFARREPALFLGAAVAIGFLAVRFIYSSGERARQIERDTSTATPESRIYPESGHLH